MIYHLLHTILGQQQPAQPTTITPTPSGHGLHIYHLPSWLLSRSSRDLRLLGAIGSNSDWDGQILPQLGHIPTCPACGKLWEDTDDRWTHVLAGCSVVTDQVPSTLGWIQYLITVTSLDFTFFTIANAFAGLFSTICAILKPALDDDKIDEANSS